MSFSSDVKNELARLPVSDSCCLNAELSGLLRMGGSIIMKDYSMGVDFSTENAALARRVLQLIKSNFSLPIEVLATRSKRLKKNNRYRVRIVAGKETQKVMELLGVVGMMDKAEVKNIFRTNCCRRSFLRGVFLAGGSVSKPTGDYHLEIVSQSEEMGRLILKVMRGLSITSKMTDRKDDYIVYIKEADAIITFLSLVGAHGALLQFENVRIIKDMRNHVNRVVNCETANIEKTVKAAGKQLAVIKYIDETLGLDKLTLTLQEAAHLRLEHTEANLSELAELAGGDVGKAGMNHRFRKLAQIAQQLGRVE